MTKKLNLLPASKQKELYYEELFYSLMVMCVVAVIMLLLGVFAQIGTRLILAQQKSSVESQILSLKQSVDQTENDNLKKEIKIINNQLADFDQLYNQTPQWSNVIKSFAKQVPAQVLVSNLEANLETREISISGYAPTRELVIQLYNNINSDKEHFERINYPLENVAKPVDIDFSFTFFIKPNVLIPTQ